MNLQCAWRNVIPFGDLDEERILKVHCSNRYVEMDLWWWCSMLKECRPSLRTGITIGYRDGIMNCLSSDLLDTRDSQQQPTEGSYSLIAMVNELEYEIISRH